jgi:hypothetical protein
MGSTFQEININAPADIVWKAIRDFHDLSWTPTFTRPLLRKDMDLGLSAGEKLGVPLPVAAAGLVDRLAAEELAVLARRPLQRDELLVLLQPCGKRQ